MKIEKEISSWARALYLSLEARPDNSEEIFKNLKKSLGKKIVFTAGAWDMLHVGQARYLAEAKEYGDILVVGVSSNKAIEKVKGKGRPVGSKNKPKSSNHRDPSAFEYVGKKLAAIRIIVLQTTPNK